MTDRRHGQSKTSGARQAAGGFTLAEVMVGATLGAFVVAGVLSAYIFLLRSGFAISAYGEMDQHSRRALEQLGIDARMASALASKTDSSGRVTSVTLTVPENYESNGNKVTYAYDSASQVFYLVPGDGSSLSGELVLARDVTAVTFDRLDASGARTSSDSSARLVQCEITLQKSATGSVPVSDVVRKTFLMRNVGAVSTTSSSSSSSGSSSGGESESDDSHDHGHGHGDD